MGTHRVKPSKKKSIGYIFMKFKKKQRYDERKKSKLNDLSRD